MHTKHVRWSPIHGLLNQETGVQKATSATFIEGVMSYFVFVLIDITESSSTFHELLVMVLRSWNMLSFSRSFSSLHHNFDYIFTSRNSFAENVQISWKISNAFASSIRDFLPQEREREFLGARLLFHLVCALDLSDPSCVYESAIQTTFFAGYSRTVKYVPRFILNL